MMYIKAKHLLDSLEKSNQTQTTKVAVGIVTSSGCRPKADLLQCDVTTFVACRMLLFPT